MQASATLPPTRTAGASAAAVALICWTALPATAQLTDFCSGPLTLRVAIVNSVDQKYKDEIDGHASGGWRLFRSCQPDVDGTESECRGGPGARRSFRLVGATCGPGIFLWELYTLLPKRRAELLASGVRNATKVVDDLLAIAP
jgi:hypothetical protein